MNKESANEQVFPLDSIGQCPIGHLVSPLMSTTSTLSAVRPQQRQRCQQCPLSITSTASMTSTMSRNPTPLGGVAKRERAPVVGGAWFFDVIDVIDVIDMIDSIDSGRH